VCRIRYQIPDVKGIEGAKVRLNIYNVMGQQVRSLVSGKAKPGYYTVSWRAKDRHSRPVAAGVYFYTIQVTQKDGKVMFQKRRKMILLK
jgi:hypothetical protein